ncbi:hypothetical protein ACWC0C_19470 [Streptomyces sp. NPDC001709]
MADTGWQRFGLYGADGMPQNVHGGLALARSLEELVQQFLRDGGIKSPVTSTRGLNGRLKYLATHEGGVTALRQAGVAVTDGTIRRWFSRTQRPGLGNRELVDTAYWTLRAHNMLRNLGWLKRHLDNKGRGITLEIYPVDQTTVRGKYRRDLNVRTKKARREWPAFIDAFQHGNETELKGRWEDFIRDIDSDWAAYTYVSHVGLIGA